MGWWFNVRDNRHRTPEDGLPARGLAVKDPFLGVRKGEVFGFAGPNGAGKSTSLNMMFGLLKPIQGRQ